MSANDIASCVLAAFECLPSKFKPIIRPNGLHEWTPLCGIVVSDPLGQLRCVALATGAKCLPVAKMSQADGMVIHDSHAEILAIRAFNKYLIHECDVLANGHGSHSDVIQRRPFRSQEPSAPFELKPETLIHMYCSEAPCGDASMELVMRSQKDPTPWERHTPDLLRGHGNFSELGVVRRKPARPDAPISLSKSCTDKLCLRQYTSLLSSATTMLLSPKGMYLKTLVLPESQLVRDGVERAFSRHGRLKDFSCNESVTEYSLTCFKVEATKFEFPHSRRVVAAHPGENSVTSKSCTIYSPYFQERLVQGVLQGRTQSDPKGASAVCRKETWRALSATVSRLELPELAEATSAPSYRSMKNHPILKQRREAKTSITNHLLGWIQNQGDDQFRLNTLLDSAEEP